MSNTVNGSAIATVSSQGIGQGFYKDKGSFLSDQKKIFDGYYYQEFCVDENALILTADLRWMPAKNLLIGNKLIGFDEELVGKIKLKPTIVENINVIKAKKYKIVTDKGETIVSKNHQFVKHLKKNDLRNMRYLGKNEFFSINQWCFASNLNVGDCIVYSWKPWNEKNDYESGWMAGVLDGEGWCSSKSGNAGFGQNKNVVLDKALSIMKNNFIEYYHQYNRNCNIITAAGIWNSMKMLGIFRPLRLLENSEGLWNGKTIYRTRKNRHIANILDIQDLGIGTVVTLGTSTKTLISDGFLSHNSYDIISTIQLDKYKDVLKKVVHTAGFIFFGTLEYVSQMETANLSVTTSVSVMFSDAHGNDPQSDDAFVLARSADNILTRGNDFVIST